MLFVVCCLLFVVCCGCVVCHLCGCVCGVHPSWCLRGPMDKASAYEAGDCGFESRRRLLLFFFAFYPSSHASLSRPPLRPLSANASLHSATLSPGSWLPLASCASCLFLTGSPLAYFFCTASTLSCLVPCALCLVPCVLCLGLWLAVAPPPRSPIQLAVRS